MSQEIRSVLFVGKGLLRWPTGEERVHYRVTIGFDGAIQSIHIGPPLPDILRRPGRHGRLFLHTPEGRRMPLNVAPNGHLSPDGPVERSVDGQDWWIDSIPWLPFETPDRLTLAMRTGSVQIFESCATPEEAEEAYRTSWPNVDSAEVRPFYGRPIHLK